MKRGLYLHSISIFTAKYCGKTLPEPINASTHSLYIMFHSDELGAFKGFKAEWSSTPVTKSAAKGNIPLKRVCPVGMCQMRFHVPRNPCRNTHDVPCTLSSCPSLIPVPGLSWSFLFPQSKCRDSLLRERRRGGGINLI